MHLKTQRVADKAFEKITESIKTSGLEYFIQHSPYSASVKIRGKYSMDYSPTTPTSHQFSQQASTPVNISPANIKSAQQNNIEDPVNSSKGWRGKKWNKEGKRKYSFTVTKNHLETTNKRLEKLEEEMQSMKANYQKKIRNMDKKIENPSSQLEEKREQLILKKRKDKNDMKKNKNESEKIKNEIKCLNESLEKANAEYELELSKEKAKHNAEIQIKNVKEVK